MNEEYVKKLFEKHATNFRIVFEKEVPVENGKMDYEILSDNKRFAVEAKGTRSDEHSTIGQLLNAKKTYSHIYLLAPINFLKKVWNILQATNTLTRIGLMTVSTNGLHVLKKPDPESYYYNLPTKISRKKLEKKHMFIKEIDIDIESCFKDQIFTISDIARRLNITMRNAYHRIARLKAAGMIEEVSSGNNPKTFKFIKSRKIDETVEL